MNRREKPTMRRIDRGNRRRESRRGGAVVVESAIVLTTLIVVLFGMLDLSLLVLESNTLAEAARRLCRQAAVHGQMASPQLTVWGPTTITGTASDGTDCATALKPELVTFDLTKVSYAIDWPDGTNQPGYRVRVTVNYQYQPMMPLILGNSAIPIQMVTTMQVAH
jgi:Flp pilus assembly protein TadG